MTTSGSGAIQTLISGIALGGRYAFVFWRIAKRNENQVIEFGGLALGSVLFWRRQPRRRSARLGCAGIESSILSTQLPHDFFPCAPGL
jgi:hypothetical protein